MGYDRVITFRPDTQSNWNTNDPVLANGEASIETDTGLVKVGNGTDDYIALPYHSSMIRIGYDITDATDITITLPDVTDETVHRFYYRTGSGTGKVLFATTSSQTINGLAASSWYLEDEESIILEPGDSEWKVISYGGYDQSGNFVIKTASGGIIHGESALKLDYIEETVDSKTLRTLLKIDGPAGYPPTRFNVYNRTVDGGNILGIGQNIYLTYNGGSAREDASHSGALYKIGGDGNHTFQVASGSGAIYDMLTISTAGVLGSGISPVGYYYSSANYLYFSKYQGYMTIRSAGTVYMRPNDDNYYSWFSNAGFGTKGGVYGYNSSTHPNLGDSSKYFNGLYYKTLNDVGCLGWFDEGVELRDGRKVSDVEAIQSIKKHPTKKTVYGVPMLDYETFPKVSYTSAPIAKEDKYEEDPEAEESKRLVAKKGEKIGEDSVEMTSMFSIMFGAIKELDNRLKKMEDVNV